MFKSLLNKFMKLMKSFGKVKLSPLMMFVLLIVVLLLSQVGYGSYMYYTSENYQNSNETVSVDTSSNEIKDASGNFSLMSGFTNLSQEGFERKCSFQLMERFATDIETFENRGISKDEIPEGEEDLYILKSEIVPPVCPRCPAPECPKSQDNKKCPPCKPCGRCPEPEFDCQKVRVNNNSREYSEVDVSIKTNNNNSNDLLPVSIGDALSGNSGSNNDNSPLPVLTSFSSFGL